MLLDHSALTRRVAGVVAGAAVTITGAAVLSTPAHAAMAPITCTHKGTSLAKGQGLSQGQCINSTNGKYTLILQGDGNLVSYRNSDHTVCFNGQTNGYTNEFSVINGGAYPIEGLVAAIPGNEHFSKAFSGSGSGTLNVSVGNSHGEMYVGYTAYTTGGHC